jgi:hypothetical protein
MVAVAQSAEHWTVDPGVAGSIPVSHPALINIYFCHTFILILTFSECIMMKKKPANPENSLGKGIIS